MRHGSCVDLWHGHGSWVSPHTGFCVWMMDYCWKQWGMSDLCFYGRKAYSKVGYGVDRAGSSKVSACWWLCRKRKVGSCITNPDRRAPSVTNWERLLNKSNLVWAKQLHCHAQQSCNICWNNHTYKFIAESSYCHIILANAVCGMFSKHLNKTIQQVLSFQ